ncbi:MAG: phenylalanine--tRNA ligase subunit alpha [Candidatus Shikimatogenerans sp. JK-2022]|nr:phenylalanine--tRNA ligase subunit alpha [Candidatus Shikimatogenerans bostrichidophilus]
MKNIDEYIKKINKKKNKQIKDIIKFKKKYLNKKGIISFFINKLKITKNKKELGKKINLLKKKVLLIIKTNKKKKKKKGGININYDFFYNKNIYTLGGRHPINIIKEKIINILYNLNFKLIYDGKEIEDDWHNFEALNFPKYHPSREMQDTYYIKKKLLLRTHTSATQIRYMEKNKPPIKIFTFGKVYRNETVSKKSSNMFHQVELLYVNKNVTFLKLKQIIEYLILNIFNKKLKYRYRLSYFPFTKPSFEIDLFYKKKWIEIGGVIEREIGRKVARKIQKEIDREI